MQFLSKLWPNHLPPRMGEYRELYEHYWIIETADEAIDETRAYFNEFFAKTRAIFLNVPIRKKIRHFYIDLWPEVQLVVIMQFIKKK